jgi:hypothetical protein
MRMRFWLQLVQRKGILCNCGSITRDCARVNDKSDNLGVIKVLQDLVSESRVAGDVYNSYCLFG